MTALELSRLQFAVVTIYHYLFVPLSISLAALTAGLQTAWLRTGDERWWRLTLLVGKLLMATFAVGVVTGLVQEFQFGMAWSAFARFYGDVFGPTLAIEGMLAFFLEATFLGLWWFGRDRLGPRLHLATIWVVAVGTLISAYVILAANAFMQNPVGYSVDPATGRAVLASFGALLTNEVVLAAFPHTVAGAFAVGGGLLLAIGAHRTWRRPGPAADRPAWRSLARVGAWTTLVSGIAVAISGDTLGKVMTAVQPMKMAAAEALYATRAGAPFSVFAVGAPGSHEPAFSLDVPWLLSVLATGNPTATVQGIDDLQAQYTATFGPGDYVPWVPLAYWAFRAMIGFGMLAAALAAWVLWRTRRGRDLPGAAMSGTAISGAAISGAAISAAAISAAGTSGTAGWALRADRVLLRSLPLLPLLPTLAATAGWVFTETARQPWLVFGLFRTGDGVSPTLGVAEAALSLAGFAVVYGALAVVWLRLVRHVVRRDLAPATPADPAPAREPAPVY